MTILNAWISRDEAIVASDTVCRLDDGTRGVLSKVRPIPHLNVVLAGRGQSLFMDVLSLRCLNALCESFDQLVSGMPEHIAYTEMMVPGCFFPSAGEPGYEIVVVGWSDRRARMCGHAFCNRGDGRRFDTPIDDVVSPWHVSMPDIPKQLSRLEDIARAQVRWMRASFGPAAAGGTLIVCRLTRTGLAIHHQLTFPAEEEIAA